MEVKKLTLHNVGRFDKLSVLLAPLGNSENNVTVFVGNNGSGKTSILKSLATSLSWLVARIETEKGNGTSIPEFVIKNGKTSAAIDIDVYHCSGSSFDPDLEGYSDDNNYFPWTTARAKKGRKGEFKSDYWGATALANQYRTQLTKNDKASLPLIAFYSVERVVIDIPLKIKYKHTSLQLDGYDKSLSKGVDFRRFFEWFREREDIENEMEKRRLEELVSVEYNEFSKVDNLVSKYEGKIDDLDKSDLKALMEKLGEMRKERYLIKKPEDKFQDTQLNAVRTAITTFMPELTNIRVQRKPKLHMAVDKNGKSLDVLQLSQGEKSLMALVGDIARRLAMMNPSLQNPLKGDGIILIDEVDMHLHPQWQRSLLKQLIVTFPQCQFVVTTHSPLVISDCKNILTYLVDDNEIRQLPSLYGEDANTVLLRIMDTGIRNNEVNEKLKDIWNMINDSDINSAKKLLENLEGEISASNVELAKAKLLIFKKELQLAKNN